MNDSIEAGSGTPDEERRFNSGQISRAIDDAENLVGFAARSGKTIEIEDFDTLVAARGNWEKDNWTNQFALRFWEAFSHLNELVKPATVDSVRAICPDKKHSGLRGFFQGQYGLSEADRAITRYTLWTLFILAIVLVFQIYWVIGNSLSLKLTELLDNESEITNVIQKARLDHDQLEVLFKLKEEESGTLQETGAYEFYGSSDWERETLQLKTDLEMHEGDLEALKIQLERNFSILTAWAFAWDQTVKDSQLVNESIQEKIKSIQDQIDIEETLKRDLFERKALQKQIDANQEEFSRLESELFALQSQLNEPANQNEDPDIQENSTAAEQSASQEEAVQQAIKEKIDQTNLEKTNVVTWLEQNDPVTLKRDLESSLIKLQEDKAVEEKNHDRWKVKEEARRLRLSAEFLLVILQVYLLPVLYGLLGASVYVLRKIMRDISTATYAPDRSYLLRLALGTLSGLIIGWFVFLLPGQSILSTLSPMALAFIVGYNIDIVFALMDKLIDSLTKDNKADKKKRDSEDQTNGSQQAEEEPPQPEGA